MRARTSLFLALTCLCCAALVGCGQTGALYLPTNDSEVVSKGPEAGVNAAPANPATPADDAEVTRKREPAVPSPAPAPQ